MSSEETEDGVLTSQEQDSSILILSTDSGDYEDHENKEKEDYDTRSDNDNDSGNDDNSSNSNGIIFKIFGGSLMPGRQP
jgi:hypothetical protein